MIHWIINGYKVQELVYTSAGGQQGFRAVELANQQKVIMHIWWYIDNQPALAEQFQFAAPILQGLTHPHILPLHDYWREEGNVYMVIGDVGGTTLQDKIRENEALSLTEIEKLVNQISDAFFYLHQQNIIVRSVSPHDIHQSDSGEYYLGGFEELIARLENFPTDAIVGVIDYIAPETMEGTTITARADMYSLGVIIWEALTGEHPFKNMTTIQRLYHHATQPLPHISTVSDAVNAVLQKAIAKNPDDRYSDMREFNLAFAKSIQTKNPPT